MIEPDRAQMTTKYGACVSHVGYCIRSKYNLKCSLFISLQCRYFSSQFPRTLTHFSQPDAFHNYEEVAVDVRKWLRMQQPDVYRDRKLNFTATRDINVPANCFEK
jgi:hypothetical protein